MCGHGILRLAFFRKREYPPPGGFQSQRSPCWNLFFMFQFSTMHVPCFTAEDEPTKETLFWPKCEQHTFIFIFQNPIRKLLWNMGYSFGIWNMILEYETTKYDLVSYYVLHIPKSCSKTIFHIQKSRSKTIFHVPKSYSKTIFQIHVPKANQPKNFMFHIPWSMFHKKMSQQTNHT